MLPQLRELELKYPNELVVIGVESGKYHAERVTSRIKDASLRLDAAHPVLNDRQFRTWRSYAVSAWPTLVAVDPAGYVVGSHAGEFTAEALSSFIDGQIAIAREKGTLNDQPIHFAPDAPTIQPGRLRYPGKVVIDGYRIAIADSGNHRVIIGDLDGSGMHMTVETTAGDGNPGFRDGIDGQMHSPQGMAFAGDVLYVADTENHSIRSIDVKSGEVRTIAGTGSQLRTRADQKAGALSSPWDVAVHGETLFIAMAGTHQLWSLGTRSRELRVHSGTGGEDLRDESNREALLAQPMGITVSGEYLYFADSESSAIRRADVSPEGSIVTIVGTGLFDFGDVDGTGDDVRLQHAQGVAMFGKEIMVADSYNDALKVIDPETRTATTWLRGLHEPEGVACTDTHVYVADTNAHRIAVIDRVTKELVDLTLD